MMLHHVAAEPPIHQTILAIDAIVRDQPAHAVVTWRLDRREQGIGCGLDLLDETWPRILT